MTVSFEAPLAKPSGIVAEHENGLRIAFGQRLCMLNPCFESMD
jgi:hypothetical protein